MTALPTPLVTAFNPSYFDEKSKIMAKLPKPRFNLKAPNSKSETLIFLIFRYRGKKVLYSTSLCVLPSEWNFNTQRPVQKERRPDLWALTRQLDDLNAYCKAIYIESEYGRISVKDFKHQLDLKAGRIEPKEPQARITFFEFLDLELEEMQAQGMRKASLGPYKLHAGILRRFAKEKGTFTFEDVDWNFRLKLIDWLAGRGVQLAYGNKTLSILRQFLEKARRKELHTNVKYQGMGWLVTKKKAKTTPVTLTPEELQLLYDMPLHGYLKKVRDLFLIGAGTGQRFSDYSRLCPDHFYKTINGVPILSIIAQKTDTQAKIPLNIFPWLLPLLEEYHYTSPQLSMQKLNEGLKILCKDAGLDEKVLVIEQYIGRKARVEKRFVPKHELISTHTCRRSFATNLYRMGYSLAQIMPMTGHATEDSIKNLYRYRRRGKC
jgi:integrase